MLKVIQPNANTVEKVSYTPYDELIRSLPENDKSGVVGDRTGILHELETEVIRARAEQLQKELSEAKRVGLNLPESRTLFLAALRNVKSGTISAAQLASLHILDSAIRTLYTNPMIYSVHKYVNEQNKHSVTFNLFHITDLRGMPTSISRYSYNALAIPNDSLSITDLPWRMQKPLMQRFFNFSASEWTLFCEEMRRVPQSEQFYNVLIAPEYGCWSSATFQLQKILKCMRVLDRLTQSDNGLQQESIMLVPSFSMFQAMINVKAHTFNRKPVELVPTYGYIESERYAALKKSGKIAVALYFPEKNESIRYHAVRGSYRTTIDGHPSETSFAGFLHDIYHAMREMSMTENVANARMRLAEIAKKHPKNKVNQEARAVDDILIDGELIHSYPPEIDTMFDPDYRSLQAEPFGRIFYTTTLRGALDADLKEAFIEDMVVNEELWKEQFNLGRADLLDVDHAIYDKAKACYVQIQTYRVNAYAYINRLINANNDSNAQIISRIGLLANPAKNEPSVTTEALDIKKMSM